MCRHDFITSYDDDDYVTLNSHVKAGLGWNNVLWAFTATAASNWHPLTWLSHMADVSLFGLNPAGHHLTSVVIHALNTGLLFRVLASMTGASGPSLLVAALFAVHPLNVESVAWVAERKNVLSTFFWILTLGAYVAYVRRPGTVRYAGMTLAFVLGLLSKPMLVTLPCVLLLLDYWPLGRWTPDRPVDAEQRAKRRRRTKDADAPYGPGPAALLREKIPLFALALVSSMVTVRVQDRGGSMTTFEATPLDLRLANAVISYLKYLGKTFWPIDLAVFYPHPGHAIPGAELLVAAAVLLALTAYAVKRGRQDRFWITGWFWFAGTLVPVIGIVQVGSQAMADRFAYVPLIGLFILVAWEGAALSRPGPRLKTGAALLVLMLLSILTWRQLGYWRDDITLFTHATRVTAGNYIAHHNLGEALLAQGRLDEAVGEFSRALAIEPNSEISLNSLAFATAKKGDDAGAISSYERAIDLKPDYEQAHANLALSLIALGRSTEALTHFQRAAELDPENAAAQENVGMTLEELGRLNEAEKSYRRTLELLSDPQAVARVYNRMGNVSFARGDREEAVRFYREALRLSPDYDKARQNLEGVLGATGR